MMVDIGKKYTPESGPPLPGHVAMIDPESNDIWVRVGDASRCWRRSLPTGDYVLDWRFLILCVENLSVYACLTSERSMAKLFRMLLQNKDREAISYLQEYMSREGVCYGWEYDL